MDGKSTQFPVSSDVTHMGLFSQTNAIRDYGLPSTHFYFSNYLYLCLPPSIWTDRYFSILSHLPNFNSSAFKL